MRSLLAFLEDHSAKDHWDPDFNEGHYGEAPSHECPRCGTQWSRLAGCFNCGSGGRPRAKAVDFSTEWEIV